MTESRLTTKFKRCLSSSFILLVVFLVFFDVVFERVNPLMLLNSTGLTGLNHYYVVSKIPQFLASPANPDVILTGSSVFLHSAIRCDDAMHGKATRYDTRYQRDTIDTYLDCDYFKRELSEATRENISISNLATAGGLISDQYFILRKCLASGRRPRLLIADISPREFHDNCQADPNKTPVCLVTQDYSSFREILAKPKDIGTLAEGSLRCFWQIFRQKNDLKEFFTSATARFTGHPATLYQAKNSTAKTHIKKHSKSSELSVMLEPHPDRLRDLQMYKRMYRPYDSRLVETQEAFLEKYLDLARKHNIPVILVKMPLRKENLQLIPQRLADRMTKTINALTEDPSVQVVLPEASQSFEAADFEDSAHLDTSGSFKLFDALVPTAARALLAQ